MRIVETVAAVNEQRKRAMARKVASALGGNMRDRTIAVLGLTFKPNTDEMRDAPSIPLITALQDMGAKVRVFDPVGMEQARAYLNGVVYAEDAYTCAENADALVIVTEWEQFRALDSKRPQEMMATLVDSGIYIKRTKRQRTTLRTLVSASPTTEKVMLSIVSFPEKSGLEPEGFKVLQGIV